MKKVFLFATVSFLTLHSAYAIPEQEENLGSKVSQPSPLGVRSNNQEPSKWSLSQSVLDAGGFMLRRCAQTLAVLNLIPGTNSSSNTVHMAPTFNISDPGAYFLPSAFALNAGESLVLWSGTPRLPLADVNGRVMTNAGDPVTKPFILSTSRTVVDTETPTMVMTDGNPFVVWNQDNFTLSYDHDALQGCYLQESSVGCYPSIIFDEGKMFRRMQATTLPKGNILVVGNEMDARPLTTGSTISGCVFNPAYPKSIPCDPFSINPYKMSSYDVAVAPLKTGAVVAWAADTYDTHFYKKPSKDCHYGNCVFVRLLDSKGISQKQTFKLGDFEVSPSVYGEGSSTPAPVLSTISSKEAFAIWQEPTGFYGTTINEQGPDSKTFIMETNPAGIRSYALSPLDFDHALFTWVNNTNPSGPFSPYPLMGTVIDLKTRKPGTPFMISEAAYDLPPSGLNIGNGTLLTWIEVDQNEENQQVQGRVISLK